MFRGAFITFVFALTSLLSFAAFAQTWSAKLDDPVRFYQATDIGAVIVGTKKSVYAVDGMTGDILWRRKESSLDENDVAPIPGTDLILLSFEKDSHTRIEAVDALSGDTIWRSEKLRGAVMQMAIETESNLLAVVLARDAKESLRGDFKRKPVVHVLDLSSGDELWRHELGSEIEMMPTRWPENEKDEVEYSLDNYQPPMFLDGRLYLFYEGATSYDARTGNERTRDKFHINEQGLALTEAPPVLDEGFIYTSGRGHVRAISRASGKVEWEAKDLGVTPELILAGRVLYARTGGQFTRLKDGEIVERGPYGVAAIAAESGNILWKYKGADKGITNLVLPDASTIMVADHDELIAIDANTGKRRSRVSHHIDKPSFAVLNESGNVVIGGREEIAAFDLSGQNIWRGRYPRPGRGLLRTIGAIAARAASLYFRFGGVASTAFRGIEIARAVSSLSSLSWSGLATRSSFSNLQSLVTNAATNSARSYAVNRFKAFGVAARVPSRLRTSVTNPTDEVRARIRDRVVQTRPRNVEDRLLDRLDPARQLDRLSRFLWHRDRLATLRGNWMYFYTDLKTSGHGLAGINIQNGLMERSLRLGDLDERFISDEAAGIIFVANGNRLLGY
ncbi:MAG TPA: PQQ-binding-like beta-propeller repeat protein, partial [Pyrinomonadaceae bacterium]|nr:PQQ-binding-like beta-propeller repeat protein [Pyrinomonadaceae bacterium]